MHWCFGSHGPIRKTLRRRAEGTAIEGTSARQPSELPPTDRWVAEVDRRGRALAGTSAWTQFTSSANQSGCRFLADLANELASVRKLTNQVVRQAVAHLLGDRQPGTRFIAIECAERIVASPMSGTRELVDALRVLGIFACVVNGRPISRCPCFQAWWAGEGRPLTTKALTTALPETA